MDPAILLIQVEALAHIANVDPELPVPRNLLSQNESTLEWIQDNDGRSHVVQVLSYLPGSYPPEGSTHRVMSRPMGTNLARLVPARSVFLHAGRLWWEVDTPKHGQG